MTAPVTAPTTNNIKSGIITNLDASPIIRATAGQGAAGALMRVVGTATPASAEATSDLIRLVRIPSNAIVQSVKIILDAAATTLAGNVGLWYSDDTRDGTSVTNAGNLTAISSAFFASAINMERFEPAWDDSPTAPLDADGAQSLGVGPVDVTFANAQGAFTDGQYIPSQSVFPIWQAVATSLIAVTTPVGAFTSTTQTLNFNSPANAGASTSVFVQSRDPGGFFDVCIQLTTTGSAANVKVTCIVDYINPGI